jgi:hypothetical protein
MVFDWRSRTTSIEARLYLTSPKTVRSDFRSTATRGHEGDPAELYPTCEVAIGMATVHAPGIHAAIAFM